jgi:hypothetical protein
MLVKDRGPGQGPHSKGTQMSANPNLLDNSGPELTGRPGRPIATATGVNPTCFIDRWWGYRGGDTGYAVGNLGGSGFPNQIALQRDPGNASTTALVVGQSTGVAENGLSTVHLVERLLNPMAMGLPAQTLVFSVHARKGTNFSGSGVTLEIVTATADVNVCSGSWTVEASATFGAAQLSAAWTRLQVTKIGVWTASFAAVLGVRVRFDAPSGTAASDDALYLTGAKLELSSTGTASAYVVPTIQESLLRCKRFYQSFGGVPSDVAKGGFTAGAMVHQQPHLFPVEMIKAPVATLAGTWSVINCSQPAIIAPTTRAFGVATTTINTGQYAYQGNSNDDLLIFDAETP